MRKEQIVGVAVRLFAIFLVIYTLRQTIGLIPYLADSQSMKVSILFFSLVTLIPILVAVFLWILPLTIASKLIPGIKTKELSTLNSTEIAAIAFPILGLWVLTSAIPDIFYWTTFTYMTKNADLGRPGLSPENVGNIVGTIVELLIGLWLLFGSKSRANLIRRLRHAGS